MSHSESWIQGFHDAYNFRPFMAGDWIAAEYKAGYMAGRTAICGK